MKTTIWLRSQPKKKIEYPDCFPHINWQLIEAILFISDKDYIPKANHCIKNIARVEFRP